MNKRPCLALGALLGATGLMLILSAPAHSQKPAPRPPAHETLTERLAREAKVPEETALKVYNALGPVLRDELRRGKTVSVPGLGTFRVVHVEGHKDLRDGRPVTVAGVNTVEFLASGELNEAANSSTARPAEVVPAFRYVPLPGQTPGQRMPSSRIPGIRTP